MKRYQPYPKYKDSGVEWLGEIPAKWNTIRIKDIALINPDVLSENTPSDFEMLYIDIGNVDSLGNILNQEPLTFGKAPSRARRQVKRGDVIVSTVRTYLHAIAPIQDHDKNLVVSTGFAVIRPLEGFSPSYAAYSMRAQYFVDAVVAYSEGVSYPAINESEMASFRIVIPPENEQNMIAAFLDRETVKIDALISKKEHFIELLKEKRTALISHTVTKGLDPNVPMKDSSVEWLGKIPRHWKVIRLKYDAPLQGGYAYKCDAFQIDGVPVVRMNNLRRGLLDLTEAARISPIECIEAFSLNEGDLLIGLSGSIGQTGRLGNYAIVRLEDLPCQLNQRVGRFQLSGKLQSDFLCFFIAAAPFTESMIADSTGTAQFNISPDSVGEVALGLPLVDEQRAIVTYLDLETARIDSLIAKGREAIDRLKEYRTALISAAVTGKIDVGEETP